MAHTLHIRAFTSQSQAFGWGFLVVVSYWHLQTRYNNKPRTRGCQVERRKPYKYNAALPDARNLDLFPPWEALQVGEELNKVYRRSGMRERLTGFAIRCGDPRVRNQYGRG